MTDNQAKKLALISTLTKPKSGFVNYRGTNYWLEDAPWWVLSLASMTTSTKDHPELLREIKRRQVAS